MSVRSLPEQQPHVFNLPWPTVTQGIIIIIIIIIIIMPNEWENVCIGFTGNEMFVL